MLNVPPRDFANKDFQPNFGKIREDLELRMSVGGNSGADIEHVCRLCIVERVQVRRHDLAHIAVVVKTAAAPRLGPAVYFNRSSGNQPLTENRHKTGLAMWILARSSDPHGCSRIVKRYI